MLGGAIQFCQNFIDNCPNLDHVAPHGYKKFRPKFLVKTKKKVFVSYPHRFSTFENFLPHKWFVFGGKKFVFPK